MPTTYIAWTGKDSKLNVQPLPAGQKATLDQTSNQSPSLAFFKNRLFMAWTGTNGKLNVTSSADGVIWKNEDKKILDQSSNVGPALIASSSVLSLVWTGTDGRLNLYYSLDGKEWVNQITLSQVSQLAPASAAGPCQVQALGWRDEDGILNVLCGIEIRMGPGTSLSETSNQVPALAFYQSLLYIAWTDITGKLNMLSSSNGIIFGNPASLTQTSGNGPALAASSGSLSLAWTDSNTNLNVISSTNGINFGNPVSLNEKSKLTPAIATGSFS